MGFICSIGLTKFSVSSFSRAIGLFCLLVVTLCQQSSGTYLNQVAVHIEGGSHIADRIASKHGFKNMGQVWCFSYTLSCNINVVISCSKKKFIVKNDDFLGGMQCCWV